MFKRILVPLDGSQLAETVLPHVMAIARGNENGGEAARITLLHVMDQVGGATRPRTVDPFDWQIRKAEAEAYLQGLASRLASTGTHPEVVVREGKAAEKVIEFAEETDSDLIMLASHGQSGISEWNVSSVVQKIIQMARTSVMIVRAYQSPTEALEGRVYQRILIPIDGSQRAESVLPAAFHLAKLNGAALVAAHVVRKPEMPRRTPLSQDDLELANRVTERNRVEAERYLADIENRFDSRIETRLLVEDSVLRALHNLVEAEGIDLVVMSAHGYTGDSKWRYGTTVVSFISYGSTPLLIFQDLPAQELDETPAEALAHRYGGR